MKNLYYKIITGLKLPGCLLATAMFFSFLNQGFSQIPQVTVVGGTQVMITAGSTLNSSENFVLNDGGTLDVQGTLILKKNLVNQNASANSLGNGAVVFSGTVNQTISGQNVIKNLELANASGLTVAGNTRVNGVLTLTNGLVTLGAFNLLLGPAATVAGTPTASNMVVAPGPGELRKEYASASSFTFPVGDAIAPPEYSPVTLAFSSGTFAPGNYAGVSVVDAAYSTTEASYLTRYWNVNQSGITSFACNPSFQYVTGDVVGTEEDIFCTRVVPTPFTAYNPANTGTHTIDAHGLASFSTFTGILGNGTTPPAVRSLQDKIIAAGMDKCADATQTLLIAGNGTTYIVQSGGNVEHIAGTNIIYYPGTRVFSGGTLYGHISGTFCNSYIHPAMQAPVVAGIENPGIGNPNNSFFKIYPNPTPGKFTLELTGDITSSQVHVEIFGILGDRILSKDMQVERKQEFSLVEKPTGVYVIHVTSGLNSETEKIIKK